MRPRAPQARPLATRDPSWLARQAYSQRRHRRAFPRRLSETSAGGYCLQAEPPRRGCPRVAGHNRVVLVDENGVVESELRDRSRERPDLPLRVLARAMSRPAIV